MRFLPRPKPCDLKGKVVLITGGHGGIGNATAEELLRRGARVTIADLAPDTPERASRLPSTDALGMVADVRQRDARAAAVAASVDRIGRVDVVIAIADLLPKAGTLGTTPESDVNNALVVNVSDVDKHRRCSLEADADLPGPSSPDLVGIRLRQRHRHHPYAMSKAGVEQLGRAWRIELTDAGASALTAYFSLVDTDMIKRGVDEDPEVLDLLGSLPRQMMKRVTPKSAAIAIADGLERRAPRVVHPARWTIVSAARGVIGSVLDKKLTTDRTVLGVPARLDQRGPLIQTSTPTTSRKKIS